MPLNPPRRTTHAWGSPESLLVYDRWGTLGRPVILLHGLLFDRTMWWPVAAELATDCTVLAPDFPGHGDTPTRADYSPAQLAHELSTLIHSLDLRRAPIVVAHGTSCLLAAIFADCFAVHAVLTVDQPESQLRPGVEDVIVAAGVTEVPMLYQQFAAPRRDPALLRAYRSWFGQPISTNRLVAAGQHKDRRTGETPFAHLRDPQRFAESLRGLL